MTEYWEMNPGEIIPYMALCKQRALGSLLKEVLYLKSAHGLGLGNS
jgi:hypothetical protein